MPGRGWSNLTVRQGTAGRVKDTAHARGLTVDELINEFLSPSGKGGWSTCSLCGAKVKSKNLQEHKAKVHPRIDRSI